MLGEVVNADEDEDEDEDGGIVWVVVVEFAD